ncbi:helix-turn-helix domain-containing protein [Dyadobacter flavalbus]|uniref:helix-turn-helix domain-containing protein n=1 Tax=Dyadobacter flavalbus TaxID=2579942 RepID=UPI00286DC2B7|nr:helix-turn-helix domain-containing protein [Dyadobacter flavalbus]
MAEKETFRRSLFSDHQHHQRPSDVYLEVGFEDLSHFSYVFKKQFGKAPSQLAL